MVCQLLLVIYSFKYKGAEYYLSVRDKMWLRTGCVKKGKKSTNNSNKKTYATK
jgi:hypothetical protein